MDITYYIRSLLYEKNTAVIDQVGVLKTVYKPSYFSNKQNKFFPPRKDLAFHPDSRAGDEQLLEYIHRESGMDKETVRKELDGYFEKITTALKKGQRVHLNKIGVLQKNKETGEIEFEQDPKQNFLSGASGMDPVDTKPQKKFVRAAREEPTAAQQPVPPDKGAQAGRGPALTAISLLIVLILVVYLLFNPHNFPFLQYKSSGMIPIVEMNRSTALFPFKQKVISQAEKASEVSTPAKKQEADKDISGARTKTSTTEEKKQEQPVARDSKPQAKEKKRSTTEGPTRESIEKKGNEPAREQPVPETQKQTGPDVQPGYYIIVSSYPTEELAREYFDELKTQGYNPTVIGPTEKGHYRVSIDNYQDKKDAMERLDVIKTYYKSSAWLIRY
ncbi:MAG: SPOR domain-containing protein [Bacteroidales bacterium]